MNEQEREQAKKKARAFLIKWGSIIIITLLIAYCDQTRSQETPAPAQQETEL